jgi:predicted Zn-dependent peptidase
MPELITTPEGLRILVDELPHTYSVSIGCFVAAGARHEAPAHGGAAHFIEHMLFKGSARYGSARLISQAVEGVGGMLNASTAYESTVYYAKVATIHVDRAVDVLGDMILRPLFDLHELEKERRVIIEEIRGLQDAPGDWVHELLQQTMWADSPLGRDIAGSVETVGAIGRADLQGYWQRYYNRANTVISVAGNIDAAAAVRAVSAAFAALPAGAPTPPQPRPAPRPGPWLSLLSRDTEQGNFCLGLPGLAYSVGSYHNDLSDAGMWVVYGSVDTEALRDAVALALEILQDLAQGGVTGASWPAPATA